MFDLVCILGGLRFMGLENRVSGFGFGSTFTYPIIGDLHSGVYTLRVHTFGVESRGQPIFDLEARSPTQSVGVHILGGHTSGATF